ncbi:MAG: hypothetical protein JNM94_02810 [Phycisphaerae bacterium]|nr:hypothetical protein [Phycisphaerae bacterium]
MTEIRKYMRAAVVAALAAGLAGPAMADSDNPDCGASGDPATDPNGGCNVSPAAFDTLGDGVLTVGETINTNGFAGTFTPPGGTGGNTNRDLDWYIVNIPAQCKLSIDIDRGDGNDSAFFLLKTNGDPCDNDTVFNGAISSFAPSTTIWATAGTYLMVVTTAFEADPLNPSLACADYTFTVSASAGDSDCGTGTSNECDVVNGTPGCNDWACCNIVCLTDATCCATAWDAGCVDLAVSQCGYFVYSCTNPGPANDCLGSATAIAVGATDSYDTTTANTDGPGNVVTGGASFMGKDVWYVINTPQPGQMLVTVNSLWDLVIEAYDLGTSSTVADPNTLPDLFIGQTDTGAEGDEAISIAAEGGHYYLIRVGGFAAAIGEPFAFGEGTITSSFLPGQVYFDTGPVQSVNFNGAPANLGLSSGDLSLTSAQRWLAMPFEVPAPSSGNAWETTAIIGKGFVAAAPNTVTDLAWIIWERNGSAKPVDGDQIASGSVPVPAAFDDPADAPAGAAFPIVLTSSVTLCPGDYYVTIYGTDPTPAGINVSNWAWFTGAADPIVLLDANNLPFAWRSALFPAPGFVVYNPTNIAPIAGNNPLGHYSTAFNIRGIETTSKACGGTPCPADLTADGKVDGADLGALLGGWGGPSTDLTGDGNTDGADLGVLLGAWGNCP